MVDFDLIISNYRCFSNEDPARLEVRPRLMSLIGPNNAGKSTLLRSIYELRPLFSELRSEAQGPNLAKGMAQGFIPVGVGDFFELFHNDNDLPVEIQIRLRDAQRDELSGATVFLQRNRPNSISAAFVYGPRYTDWPREALEFPLVNDQGRQFRLKTARFDEAVAQLAGAFYLPATRIAIGESQGSLYDLSFGNAFISMWDQWKTGPNRSQNDAIQRVTEDIRLLFGFSRLEITATSDNRDLHVAIGRKSFKLRELGAGLAQFIIVLANVAVKKTSLLLIDEPEISLHPALQLDFLTTAASYCDGATIYATHSIGLARAADAVLSVVKVDGHTRIRPFENTVSFQEFLGEMSFSAYRDLGFESVLVVEGVNDIKTAQQMLRLIKKDHSTVVLQLGGSQLISGSRAQEVAEMLRLTKRLFVLIDSERQRADAPLSEARADFIRMCNDLEIRTKVTDRRALEHYMPDRAVKLVLGDKYRSLQPFEARSVVNPIWAKSDTWRIARAMTLSELADTDLWGLFKELQEEPIAVAS